MSNPRMKDASYTAAWDDQDGILVARCYGVWDLPLLAAYRAELIRTLDKAERRSFNLLVDSSESPAQPKELTEPMRELIEGLVARGMVRAAVLTPSAIKRMQLNRVGVNNHRFFDDEKKARDWLKEG